MLKTTVRRMALLAFLPVAMVATMLPGTPASAAVVAGTTLEAQLVVLTNQQRAKVGCRAVPVNSRLTLAARRHSRDMAVRGFFSHTGTGGSTFVVRTRRAGYNHGLSENIGWGYRTASQMMVAWMKSPGHKRNILNCAARSVGLGVAYKSNGTPYYTQVFGRA